jgi:4'-phosphopantetheinyl transferase
MRVVNWPEVLDGEELESNLLPGSIQLWQASVLLSAPVLARLDGVLSSDEQARAGRFRFPRHREAYVVSRGLLRYLVASYAGAHPGKLEFSYGAQGKPAIAESKIRFNVSHSGDAVLLGFAVDREIGVDVELMQSGLDFAGLARTSFSHAEQSAVIALAPNQRANLFYEYWTCKEACIKADGRGLSAPLDQFSIVTSAEGRQWREVATASPNVFGAPWRVRIVDAIPGYAAAVAAAGSGWDVQRITLEDADLQQNYPRTLSHSG